MKGDKLIELGEKRLEVHHFKTRLKKIGGWILVEQKPRCWAIRKANKKQNETTKC